MNEGLVAKSWSDSGDVPVGEVTFSAPLLIDGKAYNFVITEQTAHRFYWENGELVYRDDKPSDPNAKPSNPALCRVAGEAYRGLGWCDE
jgi:hypothetical protein